MSFQGFTVCFQNSMSSNFINFNISIVLENIEISADTKNVFIFIEIRIFIHLPIFAILKLVEFYIKIHFLKVFHFHRLSIKQQQNLGNVTEILMHGIHLFLDVNNKYSKTCVQRSPLGQRKNDSTR